MPERRYSDRELTLILKHAAELQEGLTAVPRGEFTLEEIQSIAASAGIDGQNVLEAARSLPVDGPDASGLRAATRYEFSEYVPYELTHGNIEEIVDAARRELGEDGAVSKVLDSVEWRAKDSYGTLVAVTGRKGGTRLKVVVDGSNLEARIYSLAVMFGTLGIITVGTIADISSLPGLVALTAGGAATAYASATALWRATARTMETRGRQLFALIARVATTADQV